MKPSQKCINLVKQFEGFSATPYLCPAGVWTIGYGHTEGVTEESAPITEPEACDLLAGDLEKYSAAVNRLVKVPLKQHQFDALVSFAYNVGTDEDADTIAEGLGDSTLLAKLNQGFYEAAAREFLKWTKSKGRILGGLVKRRAAEQALFMGAA